MSIEHFFYGLLDGKIVYLKSNGVNDLISDKNLQRLRTLTIKDSEHYLWLPTEQVIALPHITETADQFGRKCIQNQTLLIPVHEYIQQSKPYQIFAEWFKSLKEGTET